MATPILSLPSSRASDALQIARLLSSAAIRPSVPATQSHPRCFCATAQKRRPRDAERDRPPPRHAPFHCTRSRTALKRHRNLPSFRPRFFCSCSSASSGRKNKFGHFLVVVQLIHRLMQADISCRTMASLFFFPLLGSGSPVQLTPFVFFFSSVADATWLSTNFGVIICIECSGIHREMGVHVSKIQSLTLDNIGTSQLLVSRVMTNDAFNKVMEATAGNANGNGKIKPTSTM